MLLGFKNYLVFYSGMSVILIKNDDEVPVFASDFVCCFCFVFLNLGFCYFKLLSCVFTTMFFFVFIKCFYTTVC